MTDVELITQQALDLDLKERARLAERLLKSLDGVSEEEIQELWLDEAERRIQEYRAGRMEAAVSDQVFREAENLLR
jgi:putative addiction module component (TIGR02574 family)